MTIDELKKEWSDAHGRPVDGALILAVHALWRSGNADESTRAAVADEFGLTAAQFQAACEFHARAIQQPATDELHLCLGVTCRLASAAALHARLRPLLGEANPGLKMVDVHCLGQCGHGPNMRIGTQVLCTGLGEVVDDVRNWRPAAAGPQPIEYEGPSIV